MSMLSQYEPQALANAVTCAVGASGIGILWGSLRRQHVRSALERTLEGFLALASLALTCRAITWIRPDLVWFDRVINLCVTLLPLVFLLYCERMLRRHAPRWFKLFTTAGCATFFTLSLDSTFPHTPAALRPFVGFMAVYYITLTFVLLTGARRGLFPGERSAVGATVVAFWAMVPLLITEFIDDFIPLGQRWGAVAGLAFVYVNVRYQDTSDHKLRVALELATMAAQAFALAGVIWMISPGMSEEFGKQLCVIFCAVVLTYQILSRARAMRASSKESRFVRWLSSVDTRDLDAFLTEARARGTIAVVTLDDASNYDPREVARTFARAPRSVARVAWLKRESSRDESVSFGAQQILAMLGDHEMTHAAYVEASPPRVLMINSRRAGREGREELELAVMRAWAELLSANAQTLSSSAAKE